jgi:hypothetical protein
MVWCGVVLCCVVLCCVVLCCVVWCGVVCLVWWGRCVCVLYVGSCHMSALRPYSCSSSGDEAVQFDHLRSLQGHRKDVEQGISRRVGQTQQGNATGGVVRTDFANGSNLFVPLLLFVCGAHHREQESVPPLSATKIVVVYIECTNCQSCSSDASQMGAVFSESLLPPSFAFLTPFFCVFFAFFFFSSFCISDPSPLHFLTCCLQPGLSYDDTLLMYRKYRVVLNINSVTQSPTMCARRAFEVRANIHTRTHAHTHTHARTQTHTAQTPLLTPRCTHAHTHTHARTNAHSADATAHAPLQLGRPFKNEPFLSLFFQTRATAHITAKAVSSKLTHHVFAAAGHGHRHTRTDQLCTCVSVVV